ncbi:unnamed protein product [Moneuplotes crassus]|uniref:ubiquitinyl hydrolase 1 n=1 Tax=Euplotes crassus TaxID=5936 RepID=A0AAD1UR09_EUPCR|nr:unnamed protein product [Moneuplotes crassus]
MGMSCCFWGERLQDCRSHKVRNQNRKNKKKCDILDHFPKIHRSVNSSSQEEDSGKDDSKIQWEFSDDSFEGQDSVSELGGMYNRKELESTVGTEGERKFSEEGKEEYGNKGIINPRFDCFINSTLQVLLSIPGFVEYFYGNNVNIIGDDLKLNTYFDEVEGNDKRYSSRLRQLMIKYFSHQPGPVNNERFRALFDGEYPSHEQNDSLQFLMSLFELLQYENNPKCQTFCSSGHNDDNEAWEKYKAENTSIIDKLFVGMYKTTFKCKDCNEGVEVYEEFKSYPLECYSKKQKKSFRSFIKEPKVDHSQMMCKACNGIKDCKIVKKIIRHPKYLIFAFQRLDTSTNKKITAMMDLPKKFTVQSSDNNPITFSLHSCILHFGSLNSGHYTAICKRGSSWYHFNDCQVTKIPNKEVKTSNAYILFYKQEN